MTDYQFSNFPKATVTFGKHFSTNESERLKENVSLLNSFAASSSRALEHGQKYLSELKGYAIVAGKLANVMSVLVILIGDVDKLYKKLKQLEQKMYSTIFEGKIQALNRNLSNLQDASTSEMQKVAEIVNAISNLDELLPVFSNDDSIFRERYYQGASMFVRLCVILKSICLIAEETNAYNTSNLHSLKQGYQKTLDWYRIRCIGRRMASCYVKGMLSPPGGEWTNDWDRHYEKYKKYYETSVWIPWMSYGENLGGEGWRLWCGWATYCNLVDTWDTRAYEEVEFEPFEIKNTSEKYVGNGEVQYYRDVLAEYRRRVEEVMQKFFDEVSVVS